ncbi:MAG: DUF2169 domain-containing protein [Sandaracinaceae bacterium]|nr:DUF2169 domain-containing protein [Sandaracinaceae bacterium]
MDPPPLRQGTPATVQVVPQFDGDGSIAGIVLIKERFVATRQGRVVRAGGATVHIADEPWDPEHPESSSIKYPSDLCLRKPTTDVVIVGAAIAPYRAKVTELDVLVRVGPVQKALRVFGPRAWYKGGVGKMQLTKPEPFEQQNLQWEFAWGGSDYETDPEHPIEEPRNPNGRGLVRDADTLAGQIAPAIEDPAHLIQSHRTQPPPAGVGAIGRNFAPRRSFTGTFDEQWMQERMPLLPLDFDERFNQVAPPWLVAPQPLRGGERVEITNMHEEGPVAFELPKLRFFVGLQTSERLTESSPQLDTVLIEPNLRQVDMTWRALVRLPRKPTDVRFVQVHEKQFV